MRWHCYTCFIDEYDAAATAFLAISYAVVQLLSASKGEELWSASLEQASHATRRLLLPDAATGTISLVAYTPG
jgi:hypothetical protein